MHTGKFEKIHVFYDSWRVYTTNWPEHQVIVPNHIMFHAFSLNILNTRAAIIIIFM